MLKTIERTIPTDAATPERDKELSRASDLSARAWLDVKDGLQGWRLWWLLGIGDIRQRYRRSRLGQFWITLSVAIFVTAIGVVYAAIFRQPIAQYLPYLATTFVVWGLISGIVNDSAMAFVQAEGYLRQQSLPKTSFVLRVLTRNVVVFGHNVVILPVVYLLFGVLPSWTWLLALVGLAMIIVAGYLGGLTCAILCARFRDLPQIIQNIMQVAFFVTPVTWQVEFIAEPSRHWVAMNPFAAFLRLVAEPLLGRWPDPVDYAVAAGSIAGLAGVAWPLFGRFRSRIVYWL
jgi:lipopolysaccharide transport system permease protein